MSRGCLLVLTILLVAGCARPAPPPFPVNVRVANYPRTVTPPAKSGEGDPKADGKPASYWIAILQNPEETTRTGALASLRELGEEAVPVLVVALKNDDPAVRMQAARVLEEIGADAVKAQPALVGALRDQNPAVRNRAAAALGMVLSMGEGNHKEAVPALQESLKDPNDTVRATAAWALGHLGAEAQSAVPALTQALQDKNAKVSFNAFEALGHIGPAARTAVPQLQAIVQAKGDDLDVPAFNALSNIGPAVVPVLLEALKKPNDDLRLAGLDNLLEALQAPDVDPPPALLQEIDQQARAAVPGIAALLKDEKERIRGRAAEALGQLGTKARAAVPALQAALNDKSEMVRKQVTTALAKIGSEKD